jgi:ABC-type sugar transport system ATPase subunit
VSSFVVLDNVSHAYGARGGGSGILAVEGLTIAVNRGEFAAVVGPSGCGKSTLMKLATGLQFPFKGTVQVAGEIVHQPVKIAGMAFQAPTLLPWRTTLDNLLLALKSCSHPSGSPASAKNFRGSSRAACSNAPRSAARSSTSPNFSCSMSRSLRSMPSRARSCGASSATFTPPARSPSSW